MLLITSKTRKRNFSVKKTFFWGEIQTEKAAVRPNWRGARFSFFPTLSVYYNVLVSSVPQQSFRFLLSKMGGKENVEGIKKGEKKQAEKKLERFFLGGFFNSSRKHSKATEIFRCGTQNGYNLQGKIEEWNQVNKINTTRKTIENFEKTKFSEK